MKRDRRIQFLLLRQVREGKKDPGLDDLPDELVCYNAALLIEDGHLKGVARKGADRKYSSTKLTGITSSGHDLLEQLEREFDAETTMKEDHDDSESMMVFISHASADADVAERLAKLLCLRCPFHQSRSDAQASMDSGCQWEQNLDRKFAGRL